MKYLCIHGHFYQPPRENAWLEAIEVQDSAAPAHDWNERITAECYAPNTRARVLNSKGELTDLINNYAHISFNFGPTLLSWLEEKAPQVYRAILEADKQSQQHFGGHGAAIAQVYNHMILPLANARDKETQVKWGIYDFKTRFGRMPEAMWLSETACNTDTLEVLAAHGMKYVILAPGQCARVRKIGTQEWMDMSGAKVDPKRAYQCNLPSGKQIALFFYDGPVSQGIAFSDTLKSGENLANRLMGTYAAGDDTQLVHIATDGETYGHHQKFAEMALAYCLKYVRELPDVNLTIYGEFLEKYPPQYEAQIIENTSWSCFHGVERWRSNCGCNSGRAGWHQKWRAPLRAALDFIRDEMAHIFDTKGREYFKDPWAARNDYIELILDRSLDAQHRFFLRHATETAWRDRAGALMLLEMQRHAMLMYTSCGWFFDEISGIETVQILQYAARALELHRQISGADLEPQFVRMLANAPSNIKELKNGAQVYERYVKPSAVSVEKAALQLALQYGSEEKSALTQFYCYEVKNYSCKDMENEQGILRYGQVHLKNRITLQEDDIAFAVTYELKMPRLMGGACKAADINTKETFATLEKAVQENSIERLQTEITKRFKQVYPFGAFFRDSQRQLARSVLKETEHQTVEEFGRIFAAQYPVLRGLKYIGVPLPEALTTVADYVLTQDLETELKQPEIDINAVEELLEDVRSLGLRINLDKINPVVQRQLLAYARAFKQAPDEAEPAVKLVELLNYADIFGFAPDLIPVQLEVFAGLKELSESKRAKSIIKALARKMKIAL